MTGSVRASGDATLLPLQVDLRDVRSWVASLGSVPDLSGQTDAERLISLGNDLGRKVSELGRVRVELPSRLEALATALDSLTARRAGIVRTDLIATLRTAAADFRSADGVVGKLVGQFQQLADALSLTTGVSQAATEAATHPREVGPGQSLDTQFDLMTMEGRHPGDWIFVTTKVVKQDPLTGETVVIAGRRQTLRLEAYGLYMESRGALLFADPRGKPHGNQSFEASPGLGFHWRVGLKNRPFLNRVLAPGVGVSFTLLDFVDDKDLEVGVAASATFLADLLWVGYGRNLQARMDYFYLGINPMVVVGLGRGSPVGR